MQNSINRTVILSISLIAIIASSMFFGILGSTQTSIFISSTGSISNNSLSLSCIGEDYLVNGNMNGNPSYWVTPGALGINGLNSTAKPVDWFTYFHCNTARLSFTFSDDTGTDQDSFYSYAKMNSVIGYLNSVGVKPIICDFAGDCSYFYGTTAWINDWVQVARDFKGDSRIEAFEIANEPYSNYLGSNATTVSTFNAACASLIDQIRSIDPSRTIMYPLVVGVMTTNATTFYNSLVANSIPAKGNILYDIVHPYYFEDYPLMDIVNNPSGDADAIWNTYCLPQISYFGAANCWCGETFPWPSNGGGGWNGQTTIHYNLQQTFEIAMINHFVSVGMGFQMWGFFSSSQQQADIDALTNSDYYSLIHS